MPASDVGMADIEDVVQIQVRHSIEQLQALGGGEFVRSIFQQDFHSALAGETRQFFERREGRFDRVLGEFLTADAEVLDQIAERNDLGDFEGALDFVHPADAFALLRSVMLMCVCGPERPQIFVGVHRRMQRVQLQSESRNQWPSSAICDLVAVVQMLRGAEDLDGGDARAAPRDSARRWSADD